MQNWMRTLAWIGLAVAATYTLSEWAVSRSHAHHVGRVTTMVEQDGAGSVSGQQFATQQVRDAAPPVIDVEAAYRATLQKHVDKHQGEVNRLDLELQRIERQMNILHELKLDQDQRLVMAGRP